MYRKITISLLVFTLLFSVSGCRRNKEAPVPVSESALYITPVPATPVPTPYPGAVTESAPEDYDFFDPDIEVPPADTTQNPPTYPGSDINPEESTTSPSTPAPTETPSEPDSPEEPEVTPAPAVDMTEYEAYNAMSADEQMAFYETFDSMADFVEWYNNAQAEYEATHGAIEVGDGNIDLSEIINAQS